MEQKNEAALELLADGLRDFMHRMRWTQERLAKELGFKRQGSVSAVLRGRAQLNYSQIFRLLCLGMTLRELFGDSIVDAETTEPATSAGSQKQALDYEQAAPAGGQAFPPFGYAYPAYAPAFGQMGFQRAPAAVDSIHGAASDQGFASPTSRRSRSFADALSFEQSRLKSRRGEGGAETSREAPKAAAHQSEQASPELAERVEKLEKGIDFIIKAITESKGAPANGSAGPAAPAEAPAEAAQGRKPGA